MGAVYLSVRAELHRRRRSWLAIAFLISIVGGLVLAATAAGRRTESAFPRFVAAHGFDAEVYAARPVPKIAALPDVTFVITLAGPDNGPPTCACTHPITPTDFGVTVMPANGALPFQLVSGHLPDPSSPDQVLAAFTLQQDGVHLGSVIDVPFYARSQAAAYNDATGVEPRPTGPTVAFRVVGFEATEVEFPSGTAPTYLLYATSAFARSKLSRIAGSGDVYLLRLRHGAADLPRFDAAISTLAAQGVEGYESEGELAASVEASIYPQAIGWWVLAALATLVGLAVIGQGLARQSIIESEDYPTLAAIGMDRRELLLLGTARNLLVGLVGAVGAVVIAVALSPIAPLGEARSAESSTGVSFDAPVLSLGVLGVVAVVLALGLWPATRAARALPSDARAETSRSSVVASRLAAAGAPPSAVIGVRNALERRSGGASIPVGSALLGTVLAVIALCGTAVFGASLSHLTATPTLYGDPFQINFTDPVGNLPPGPLLTSLERDPAISAITDGVALETTVNNLPVGSIAATPLRGRLLFSIVTGHFPTGNGQIGLGATTMRQIGAHVGSVVHVTASLPSGGKRTAPFRVVAQLSFPVLGGVVSLGSGAAFTTAGYESVVCPRGPKQPACQAAVVTNAAGSGLLTSVVSGARGQRAMDRYLDAYQSIASLPITPTSLINFGEAVNFPLIFGAMLAAFGAATLAHLLIVTVSRRRREVGLLKVLGFVNGQVASTVAWQATTLAVVGIALGVPLGVIVGQAVWKAFATHLGVIPVSVVPTVLLCVLVSGVLIAANLIAITPALIATRSRPGELLRTS